jgi:hypothetical protein
MSGLLDNKTRVLDTILTLEGRRQLSQGGIDIAYVAFSDSMTFYRADIASGSQDATKRIYLESSQLPQDQVTFQADDSGNVVPFGNGNNANLGVGKILNYTYTGVTSSVIGGGSQNVTASQGNDFTDNVETLLASSADNFSKLMVLATIDPIFKDDEFLAGPDSIAFQINDTKPIRNKNQFVTHITALDSIFSDPRFSHLPNFKFLPPINKVSDQSALGQWGIADTSKVSFLGAYAPWGLYSWFRSVVLGYEQIAFELSYYESLGYMRQINFDPTSIDNNLVGQFFERNYDTLKKLDIVNYGRHRTGDADNSTAHIFFCGKVMVDEKGTDTFIHLFTLVFK